MPEIRPQDTRLRPLLASTSIPRGWRPRLEAALSSAWAIRLLIPGLVAGAGLTILVIGDGMLRQSLDTLGRARFTDQSSHLAEHLRQAMERAQARLAALEVTVTSGGADLSDATLARAMQLSFDGNPVIAWMSVSTPDGRFRGLSRIADQLVFADSQPGPLPGQPGSEQRQVVAADGTLSAFDTRSTTYDPRTRPFYAQAATVGRRCWTEPYTFFATHVTGITCAAPLFAADGRLLAVLTVDFDNDSIGTTLAQFSAIPGSHSMVFASDGTVLGTTGTAIPSRTGNRVTNLLDLRDQTFLLLAQRLKDDGIDADGDLPAGNGILAAVRTLSPAPGVAWSVITYAPEDEVLGPANALRLRGALIALGAITAAALVGLLVANALARARRERSEAREQARQAREQASELGAYRLLTKLGEGGMGEVWRAEHRQLARPAAIKLMRDLGKNPEFAARFVREAQVIASLSSRNTIGIYDYGVAQDGALYYVMELLDGLDLEQLVQQYGAVNQTRVVSILRQTCLSLAEAHDRGLVHRDIKPANIYLCRLADEVDVIKVLDFGLVLSVAPGGGAAANRLSTPGMVSGSPICMAPEQACGQEVDQRADLYALGCVAWWLLSGKLPFNATDPMAMMLAHVNSPLPDLRTLVPGLSSELADLVHSLLAKDAAARPMDARAVSYTLRMISLHGGPLAGEPWDEEIAAVWWQRHRPRPAAPLDASTAALSGFSADSPATAITRQLPGV